MRPRLLLILILLWGPAAAPSATPQNRSAVLEELLGRGVAALKAGDLETAEKSFTEALSRGGQQHPLVQHNLGLIAQQRGAHERAVTYFRAALRLQPDYAPARLLLGSSLLALGKTADSTRELERAVALLPAEPEAHRQLARAYEAANRWPEAVREYRRLVELAPQEAEYAYQLGSAYKKLSEWSYGQIARLDAQAARLHQTLGQEYLVQGKYGPAISAYQRAAQADPRLPEIHLALALIYLELRRFDEALAEIERELTLVPESRTALDVKQRIIAGRPAPSP